MHVQCEHLDAGDARLHIFAHAYSFQNLLLHGDAEHHGTVVYHEVQVL